MTSEGAPPSCEVRVSAGTLLREDGVPFSHQWTEAGVRVESAFTGAHLLHLAVAGCVLNDVYREAARLGFPVGGVVVTASGGFDTGDWHSTGIAYEVEVDSPAPPGELEKLLRRVAEVAEIPRAVRAGAAVHAIGSMTSE